MKEEIKTNPYSGVSFEYNGHTWGMCARDNGVEILVDGKVRTSVFEEPKLTDEALEKEVEKYCKDKGIVYEEDLNMLDFARHFAELSKYTGESAVNSQPKIEPKFKIGDKIRNKKLAVEDNELTWEDISSLKVLLDEVENEFKKGQHEEKDYIGYCKEVLKRFKDLKK